MCMLRWPSWLWRVAHQCLGGVLTVPRPGQPQLADKRKDWIVPEGSDQELANYGPWAKASLFLYGQWFLYFLSVTLKNIFNCNIYKTKFIIITI